MPDHVISEPSPAVPADVAGSRALPPRPPSSRWVAASALAVAFVATALAAWSLVRPLEAGTSEPATDSRVAAAKAQACGAYDTVRKAVFLQFRTGIASLRPDSQVGDSTATQAAAANARLAMTAGAAYLLGRLDPATPPPLATAVRSYASNLQDIAMSTLAGGLNGDPAEAAAAQAGQLSDAEAGAARIGDMCE